MTERVIDVLLVEDSPEDAELAMRAFRRNNFANRVHHVLDQLRADPRTATIPGAARDVA